MMLKSMASISRIATLSRQLNQFFAGYVPALLNRVDFNRCQTIYAGGDDLFVIGSWDQLPGLAKTIRSDFGRFCCGNPDFGISGGLTLHRGGYPIYRGAELAGQAEKAAKNHRGKWIKQPPIPRKDAFCFLGVPLLWEDIPRAEWIKALLFKDIKTNKGFLGFLTRVAAGNKHRVKELVRMGIPEAEAWKRVRFETWRWRTAYQLRRRFEKEHQKANLDMWAKILFADTVDQKKTELPVHSWIELPLRWTDYANREKGGR